MGIVSIILKRIIIVSLVWKTAIQLCPQKRVREYGKSLLGIYLAFYILGIFCNLICVDLNTKYCEETEKIENNLELYKELFTITCDVKTGFNDGKMNEDKYVQNLENTGDYEKEKKEDNSFEKQKLTDKTKISTAYVESIQSIVVE